MSVHHICSLTTEARIRRKYKRPEASLQERIMDVVNIAVKNDNGVKANRIRRIIARSVTESGIISDIPLEVAA